MLIITIVNSYSTTVNYEVYDDMNHCKKALEEVKCDIDEAAYEQVTCSCTNIEQTFEEV